MKARGWILVLVAVAAIAYFAFKNRAVAEPPKKTVPTAMIESIKYVDKKNGSERRIVSFFGDSGCIKGELVGDSSIEVMHDYEYRRNDRAILFYDQQGAIVGKMRIKYEALSCDSDPKKDDAPDETPDEPDPY